MQNRRLGRGDIEVPSVTFGAWAVGGWAWGGVDEERAVEAIRAGVEAGSIAIDTAPMYGFGRSESVVGRAIAGRRERVLVLTKAGLRWDDDSGYFFFETADERGRKQRVHVDSRPESLRLEVDRSLERLGVERIDLLQIHWPDPTTPIAESMGALLDLRRAGKIREIGASNYTPEMLAEAQAALGDVPLVSDQPRYSLLDRAIESELVPWALGNGVGLLVYSPLEQGLLTGRVRAGRRFAEGDQRNAKALFSEGNRARVNAALDHVVAPIAEAHGATLAQVVIAWTAAQPAVTSVLVGARDAQQARENAAAGDLALGADELSAIRTAFTDLELERAEAPIAAAARRMVRKALSLLGRGR